MRTIDRRTILKTAAALSATALAPGCASPHSASDARVSRDSRLPARGEFVIRGATVLTMDPASAICRGATCTCATAPSSRSRRASRAGGQVIDGARHDLHARLHRHALAPVDERVPRDHPLDDPKRSYFPVTSALGPHYTPEDSYRSVRFGAAEALSAGATTVHNWAHNIRSPEHADAELSRDARHGRARPVRLRHAAGHPDERRWTSRPRAHQARVDAGTTGRLLTLGICSRNVGDTTIALRGNTRRDRDASTGAARVRWDCRSRCTRPGRPRSSSSKRRGCSARRQLVHPLLTTPEERAS